MTRRLACVRLVSAGALVLVGCGPTSEVEPPRPPYEPPPRPGRNPIRPAGSEATEDVPDPASGG